MREIIFILFLNPILLFGQTNTHRIFFNQIYYNSNSKFADIYTNDTIFKTYENIISVCAYSANISSDSIKIDSLEYFVSKPKSQIKGYELRHIVIPNKSIYVPQYALALEIEEHGLVKIDHKIRSKTIYHRDETDQLSTFYVIQEFKDKKDEEWYHVSFSIVKKEDLNSSSNFVPTYGTINGWILKKDVFHAITPLKIN